MPFGHYARLWLDAQAIRVADGKLKQSTYDGYVGLLHRYVLDEFGAHAIGSITPPHCERFRARLVAQKSKQGADGIIGNVLAPGTRKHARKVLRWVLAYATRSHGAIASNPAEATYNPGARATGDARHFEHSPMTAEQIGCLSAAIAGEMPGLPSYPAYALLVEFAAYTGLPRCGTGRP
ncbi:N-terminal phage integrase SAM-like domain-containing protein [Mycobacterium hackensackense]|uniref:N-terminal phage integrase SAM-like domain-containing protein n=1 Tax=Mycobacterium hackensackense TaxID=228909 RepID=UPI002265957E|nr:N-terminal phage integrase SAM-like domain-containing protein [Mycobacterium hackensackense]